MIRLLYSLICENVTYISCHNGLGMGVPPRRASGLSRATSTSDSISLQSTLALPYAETVTTSLLAALLPINHLSD